MESLLESIVGTSAQETLTQLVLWADQESVRRDLVNQRMDVDEYSSGVPVDRFVFDALRRLAIISKVNEPGAMIWRTEHAVFLVWKSIVTEVHNLIEKDKIPVHALLATGAVHHHLVKTGLRCDANIIVETGVARDSHHFACLIGYGATLVYPYLV